MKGATKLTVKLDDSIKDNAIFTSVTDFYLHKPDIFKYGVLNLDVPPLKIKENDFEYLQSKIPSLYDLYEDFIHLDKATIYNYATNETARVISEIIGVGVGLHYAITLLTIVPNKIKKIQRSAQKGKYLDFSFNQGNRNYEYEAKGTTYENHIKSCLDDIKAKKKDKDNTACRFGSVVLARKHGETKESQFVVCDDDEHIESHENSDIYHYLDYYKFVLSLILDNPIYNKLVRKITQKKIKTNSIDVDTIKGRYSYKGDIYLGQYFDKRLILEKIRENYIEGMMLTPLFKKLTQNIGRDKFFLGLDERTIKALNIMDLSFLSGKLNKTSIELEDYLLILDFDGIIFVRSRNKYDSQIEDNFTEDDVKERLGWLYNYDRGEKHKCGAPCRSREKEGKPCDIKTYRDFCHFHR